MDDGTYKKKSKKKHIYYTLRHQHTYTLSLIHTGPDKKHGKKKKEGKNPHYPLEPSSSHW
jgi:hypothetical protein